MELPEEVVNFSKWFETDGSDTQKIDKLASIVGLKRRPEETNDQLIVRIAQQRNNPYNVGDTK